MQLSLHKEPTEVVLVKKVNRKFVLVGDTAHANPIESTTIMQELTVFHGHQKLTSAMK